MGIDSEDRYGWVRRQDPKLDPRITPARPDVAGNELKGKVDAASFVRGREQFVSSPFADVKREPRPSAGLLTQGLFGEKFRVLDEHGDWAFGQMLHDGYVGYMRLANLATFAPEPTHSVSVPVSHIYPKPDIKAPVHAVIPFGAKVAATPNESRNGFSEAKGLGWIFARHLRPLDKPEKDYLKTASRFLNAPYLWGGRTALGLDCSGFTQLALEAAGLKCPRDSDQQQRVLGRSISDVPDLKLCKRGDLVFFPGHVGFMIDDKHLLHANATHMRVTIDEVATVASWVARDHTTPVLDIRRLS